LAFAGRFYIALAAIGRFGGTPAPAFRRPGNGVSTIEPRQQHDHAADH
jgi:hypothetical protein